MKKETLIKQILETLVSQNQHGKLSFLSKAANFQINEQNNLLIITDRRVILFLMKLMLKTWYLHSHWTKLFC